MHEFDNARALLREFKGDTYIHGLGVLPQVGAAAAALGQRAAFVGCQFPGCQCHMDAIRDSLASAGVTLLGEMDGAAPNAPRGCSAHQRRVDAPQSGRHRQLRRRQHDRCGEGRRTAAHAGRHDRGLLRHRAGHTGDTAGRQIPHPARRHPDRRQLGRAPDEVLEHHRCANRPEEADRGYGRRAAAAGVRLRSHLRRARLAHRRRRAGRHLAQPGGALLRRGQAGLRPGGRGRGARASAWWSTTCRASWPIRKTPRAGRRWGWRPTWAATPS